MSRVMSSLVNMVNDTVHERYDSGRAVSEALPHSPSTSYGQGFANIERMTFPSSGPQSQPDEDLLRECNVIDVSAKSKISFVL